MSFDQFIRGDTVEAQKKLRKLFSKRTVPARVSVTYAVSSTEKRILMMIPARD